MQNTDDLIHIVNHIDQITHRPDAIWELRGYIATEIMRREKEERDRLNDEYRGELAMERAMDDKYSGCRD